AQIIVGFATRKFIVLFTRHQRACTGNGTDRSAGIDFPNASIAAVGNVEVASAVEGEAVGMVDHRVCSRSAVTSEYSGIAGYGRNGPVRRKQANMIAKLIGDVKVTGRIGVETERLRQLLCRRIRAVVVET